MISPEVNCKYEWVYEHETTNEQLDYFIKNWKEQFNYYYKSEIEEACVAIFKERKYQGINIKPLYLCEAELFEELYSDKLNSKI